MTRPHVDAVHRSIVKIRRWFFLGLSGIALFWLLVIPGAQVLLGHNAFTADTAARTTMAADRLSAHIASRVNTWEFEGERLGNLAREALRGGEHHVQRVVLTGRDGHDLFDFREPAAPLPWLIAEIEENVSNGRVAVGRLRVT